MNQFIPNFFLLNNIYTPFYVPPKKNIFNCLDNCTIETGFNGLLSTINIEDQGNSIIPFIDISKYDYETKDWFWYDSEGFPLRIEKVQDYWILIPQYSFGRYYGNQLTFNPNNLMYDQYGKNLGFYSLVTHIDNTPTESDIKVYSGRPIILEIFGKVIKDMTDYNNLDSEIVLTEYNTESNKEFYYNFQLNKLYTNQNLNEFDFSQIKVHFFSTINSVKIKCVLSGNSGMNNYSTPTVDYYIAKLHGQYLKG
jgi:hypothetical protein